MREYCEFMGYNQADFSEFLNGKINEILAKTSAFSEYEKAFLASSEYANLLKSKAYKDAQNQAGKESLKQASFLKFALEIEKDKLLHFALNHKTEVLIIKSPSDLKEQKKFLGYEWSNRKGDEGLKELHNPYQSQLFDRENPRNETKINVLIKNAFLQNTNQIPQELEKHAFKARLVEMFDFSRAEFNKAITLNPATSSNKTNHANPFENSKFELVKLAKFCDINKFKNQISADEIKNMNLGFGNVRLLPSSQNYDWLTDEQTAGEFLNEGEVIALGVARYANIKKCKGKFVSSNNKLISIKQNMKDEILFDYIYEILVIYGQKLYKSGSQYPQFDSKLFESFQIPKPPLEIQKQIVAECEEIEKQYQTIRMSIDEYKKLIKAILIKCGICENDNNNAGGGGISK